MGCRCEDIKACNREIALLQETYRYNESEKEHDRLIESRVNTAAGHSGEAYEAANIDEICDKIIKLNDELNVERENLRSNVLVEIHRLWNQCLEMEREDKEHHQKEAQGNE